MINNIKKAKNHFIYTVNGKKYYDLSDNCNIIGHSHRLLTTIPKNSLSTAWDIVGDSVYSKRFTKFIKKTFGDDYTPMFASSLQEFFLQLANQKFEFDFDGNDTKEFLSYSKINITENQNGIKLHDMAEIYINNIGNPTTSNNDILNYYWYSELDIDSLDASVVILPKLYSGFTENVIILVKNEFASKYDFLKPIQELNSFTLICALHLYYTIKKISSKENPQFIIKNDNFIQRGRLFTLKDKSKTLAVSEVLEKNGIFLENKTPFYGYLPINLETYQIKYLNKCFITILK